MEKSSIEYGMADNTEDLDECNISVENAKSNPSSAAFDVHEYCPDVCNTIGINQMYVGEPHAW